MTLWDLLSWIGVAILLALSLWVCVEMALRGPY
jgi:hypothetical protein